MTGPNPEVTIMTAAEADPLNAINFYLACRDGEIQGDLGGGWFGLESFLRQWREGDLSEWPEYRLWVSGLPS